MSETGRFLRIAAVQMDVAIEEIATNLTKVLDLLEEASTGGAKVVVFPECALSGYCFSGFNLAHPYALGEDAPELGKFRQACVRLGVTGIVGYLELSADEEHIFNSAFIAHPDGKTAIYRKSHLPVLGVDRYVKAGYELFVTGNNDINIGPLICYDIRFPEAARTLGLAGADVIALPTNWPEGAESSPDFLTRARAWENRVYLIAADRVGTENGRKFIGRSQIVAPDGTIICEASATEETILYADIDVNISRQKRIVIEPGEWELDIVGGRRPELYGSLTEKVI